MRKLLAGLVLGAAFGVAGIASAAEQANLTSAPASTAPAMAKFSTESTVGDLLDNPAAKAVLQKHTPMIVASPRIDQARQMKFKDLQQFVPSLTTDVLKAIDDDLAKL
jgi:para-nitrobenzyl esterase